MQLFQVPTHQVTHLHVHQVVPAPFIPRIQVRSIPRQGLEPDLAVHARDESLDLPPAVDGRTIPDHQQPLPRHAQEMQEEFDAVQAVQRLLSHQGVDLARGRHPAHDGQVVASHLLPEDRRQSLGGIGPDQPRQQVEPRFVHENQHPALAPGLPSQFRPDLVPPAPDGLLVTLDGPPDRHLGRPVQFLEQTPDMPLVVADAELLLDDPGDAGAGPHLATKSVGLRPMPEELGDHVFLGVRQPGRVARCWVGQPCLATTMTGASEPSADRLPGGAQGLGDDPLIPAFLFQVQGLQPPPLTPVMRDEVRRFHAPILPAGKLDRLCAPASRMDMKSSSASPTLVRERRSMLPMIRMERFRTRPIRVASRTSPSTPTLAFALRNAETPRSFRVRDSSSTQPFSPHTSTGHHPVPPRGRCRDRRMTSGEPLGGLLPSRGARRRVEAAPGVAETTPSRPAPAGTPLTDRLRLCRAPRSGNPLPDDVRGRSHSSSPVHRLPTAESHS